MKMMKRSLNERKGCSLALFSRSFSDMNIREIMIIIYVYIITALISQCFRFLSLTKKKISAFTGHAFDQLHYALKIKVLENKKSVKCFASAILKRRHCSVTLTAVLNLSRK